MKTIKRIGNSNQNITDSSGYIACYLEYTIYERACLDAMQVVFMQVPWNVPQLGLLQGNTQQYHIINITSLKRCENQNKLLTASQA